jgi:hypothetical protein
MDNKADNTISRLIDELDSAVLRGDAEKADQITQILFYLQGGSEEDAVMPPLFPTGMKARGTEKQGGPMKKKSIKRFIGIAAAAALVTTLGITALATQFFGLTDMVIRNNQAEHSAEASAAVTGDWAATPPGSSPPSAEPSMDLIPLQGYPDSSEFKASTEWNIFLQNYDTDHAILDQVGNSPNEYTEKYPTYYVYSKEMADKLEEITAKYGLRLHTELTVYDSPDQFIERTGIGDFLQSEDAAGVNRVYGGYSYEDGAFHYDGQAVLYSGAVIDYQLGNYVKGTFSEVYLNIGDANAYREWQYTTKSGVTVSLALSETKALVIADLDSSFITVNVLAGTGDSIFGSSSITEADLQTFADLFDFSQIT